MDLPMTFWVEQYTITCRVRSAVEPPDNVMTMPSRYFGDSLTTDRADSSLRLPKVEQLPPSTKVIYHFRAKALFKVNFPLWVVRIGSAFDFRVPFDLHTGCVDESNFFALTAFVFRLTRKDPFRFAVAMEIFIGYPPTVLLWVSSLCPAPQCLEDCVVHRTEGLTAHHMPVVVSPSANNRVEPDYQLTSSDLLVAFTMPRTLSRNDLTFFWAGLMRILPAYLRTFCPRKSKPSLT